MHFVPRLFLPLFCLLFIGCSLSSNELRTAERIMENHPDSALHILQHIPHNKYKSESNRALYGLLLFQALDKKKLTLQPDSLINFSLDYYLKSNDKTRLVACYFFKARMYKSALRYEDAATLYLKALDNIQKKDDYELLGKIYGDIGDINFLQHEYKESRIKFLLAIECFNKKGRSIDVSYKLLDIGRTYYAEKDYKTAQKYIRKSLAQTRDSLLCGLALQEMGVNYYWAKQYDSAQYYLRKSLLFPSVGYNFGIRSYILADVFYNIEQYDSAYHYASISIKHPSNFYTHRECYRILVNVEYLRKDIKQMGKYMQQYQIYTDSIRKIESQTKSTVLESLHNTSVETNKTKQQNTLIIWLAILVIGTSIFIYYLLHKRSKHEKQLSKEQLSQQKRIIQKEMLLKHRVALLKKIETIKGEQAMERIKASPSEKEQLDKKLYNHLVHFDDPVFFFREMDTILNNLVSKLNSRDKGITSKEMTWCCLHLLNIPGPDILVLLDYKAQSLIKLKQRLAQKINLANTYELNDFLDGILFEE